MPAELHITLLGSPGVALDGRPVNGFVSTKAQALVYYLAATGRSHTRDALAGLLWSDITVTTQGYGQLYARVVLFTDRRSGDRT